MWNRVIEINSDNRYLSVSRGFLKIDSPEGELGRVPLDDIACLINSGHGCTLSTNVIAALAERGAPVVLVNKTYQPCALLYPLGQHGEANGRISAQIEASKPLNKQLWKQIVQRKIEAQAEALKSLGKPYAPLSSLVCKVTSGDARNIEAQAARKYWPLLLGDDFRRRRQNMDENVLLNYCYTVLRSAAARAIAATGLHPAIGIHHKTRGDALALADDLMEPFRPAADLHVLSCLDRFGDEEVFLLAPEVKKHLVTVLSVDYQTGEGRTPLGTCMVRLAQSLADVYASKKGKLQFPDSLLSLQGEEECLT